ncbi:hypothetical protein QYE76_036281 [Lolium multiflorum]|uniref:EGF-like domain-containing protein n=1 Tax=Lolium multiflorum TaxID=4521 RepID=A0AAD8R0Q4_LOLMU|nr:hypothetical protein QYE76_036281 [Lolium multiflorum]
MGCCQAPIYGGLPGHLQFTWFGSNRTMDDMGPPASVLEAEEGWFDQAAVYDALMGFPVIGRSPDAEYSLPVKVTVPVPFILTWTVADPDRPADFAGNCTREAARNVCKSRDSVCYTSDGRYICSCEHGYQGNPYIPDGCQDG